MSDISGFITANKIQRYVNVLYSESLKYFNECLDKYNLSSEWNRFILFDALYTDKGVEEIRKEKMYNRMLTFAMIYGDPESETFNTDDHIIEEIDQTVYMSQQAFYETIIACLMDSATIIDTMKFTIRHEIGHILYNRTFIGKTSKEWYDKIDAYDQDYHPKLRKNASMKTRLKWLLDYMNNPEEKMANSMVGITEEELIEDFYRTHGW